MLVGAKQMLKDGIRKQKKRHWHLYGHVRGLMYICEAFHSNW
jgi:hypothetical protein